MTGKGRMANVELLRIVAMVMILVLHFLSHSDRLLEAGKDFSAIRAFGTVLEMFCLSAVNGYVFISGYFGVKSSFKPGKAILLLCRIWFYALLIPLALGLLGMPVAAWNEGKINIYGLIQYLFPIETEHYWFISSYFMLYLLTPVLNAAAKNISKRQFQILLAGLLILFCGIKSVSPVHLAIDHYGYDLTWFICVYLTAAYFGLYGSDFLEKNGWKIYVGSSLLNLVFYAGMWFLCQRWDSLTYFSSVSFHYNAVLCLTGAVGLFFGFLKLRIKEGPMAEKIRRLGALSLGIYLLHEHIDLRNVWYGWCRVLINPHGKQGFAAFLMELFCCVILLFAAGLLIDFVRSRIFAFVGKRLCHTRLCANIRKMDESFKE